MAKISNNFLQLQTANNPTGKPKKSTNPFFDQSQLDKLIKNRYPTGLSTPTKSFVTAPSTFKPQTNIYKSPEQERIDRMLAAQSGITTGTGATGTGATGTGATGKITSGTTGVSTVGGKPVDVENEIEYLKGILNNPDSTAEAKAFAIKEGKRLYDTDITKKTIDEYNQDAIKAQEAFITKGVESNVQGLSDAQANALRVIEGQRAGIAPQFQNLRSQASTTSMQQARNFAEYMGARGASMGGTSAQAEIQRGAQLQGQFGQIGLAEQGAIQGLEDKKTEVRKHDIESNNLYRKLQCR